MTYAKVSQLKNRLSSYLKEVRRGGEVIVTDRDTAIAKITPFSGAKKDFVFREPRRSPHFLKKLKPIVLDKEVDVLQALWEEREEK